MALVRINGYPSNLVRLIGSIYDIEYSHDAYGFKFYSATLSTPLGQEYSLIVHERIIETIQPKEDGSYYVIGVLRNYASKCGRNDPSRVLVTAVCENNDPSREMNTTEITGMVTMVNKRKDHLELLVEALRAQGNYDIVPCAVWNPFLDGIEEMVGKMIHMSGSLHVRHLQKHLPEGGTEDKCLYEVHIKKWEKINVEKTDESHLG